MTAKILRVIRVAPLLLAPVMFMTQQATSQSVFRSTAADRELVSITVYNGNFALVREIRSFDLTAGSVRLEFGDVAAGIQSETVNVKSLDGGLRVLEQNYQYDLLNPTKLLEKYVGRTVKMYRVNPATGVEEEMEAEVLSVNQGTVLRVGNEITYDVPARFAFPEIPDNLIAKPTLVWLLESTQRRHRVEVSYLTNNLSWHADYVMVINDDDTQGDLTGWVTLDNRSGTSYAQARLQLVAGDVRRVSGRSSTNGQIMRMEAVAARARPDFDSEGLFEYHLYTLQRQTDLLDNEQKQVMLLEAQGIGVQKRYVFQGNVGFFRAAIGSRVPRAKVQVKLEFENHSNNQLGMPLPRGVVRVFKADGSGAQQFVGEDRIDHTPRDELIQMQIGEAFDVLGARRQIKYDATGRCSSESDWEVELRNRKDEDVTINVIEPAGGDWEIASSSHPSRRIDATSFAFDVEVPAREEVTVQYRVRVQWC